jgi:hypothetical protein
MPDHFTPAEHNSATRPEEGSDGWLRSRLGTVTRLAASLDRSRKALLALDLGAIEAGTREQWDLVRELDLVSRRRAEDGPQGPSADSPELEHRLQQSELLVRDSARLHAALLARMRGKLRVLANMLAGPSVTYNPLPDWSGGLPPARRANRRSL